MGTVVCPGLRSCLETQLVESRTLRLRLCSPKPLFSQSLELALKHCISESNTKEPKDECHYEELGNKAHSSHDEHASPTPESGGWSFLQALSNTSPGLKESSPERESTYVHPLVKRSSSTLSEKSLELCTENLGSETGTDTVENSIFSWSSLDSEVDQRPPAREQPKPRQLLEAKKAKPSSFPPPLTTINGSESLRVRSHREDGRLVIKAIKAPSVHTYFQAERSQGRLRLSFVKDSAPNFDSIGVASTEENERRGEGNQKNMEMENDINRDKAPEEEKQEFAEEQVEKQTVIEVTDDNELDRAGGGRNGNREEFQRPAVASKESDLENTAMLLNSEPFLVAVS